MAWDTIVRTMGAPPGSPLAIHVTIHGSFKEACALVYARNEAHPGAGQPTHVDIWTDGIRDVVTFDDALAHGYLYKPR